MFWYDTVWSGRNLTTYQSNVSPAISAYKSKTTTTWKPIYLKIWLDVLWKAAKNIIEMGMRVENRTRYVSDIGEKIVLHISVRALIQPLLNHSTKVTVNTEIPYYIIVRKASVHKKTFSVIQIIKTEESSTCRLCTWNTLKADFKQQVRQRYPVYSSLNSLLTPWTRVLTEKLPSPQLVRKFPANCGTRRFITVFPTARHLSLSWATSIQSMPPFPFWKIHFNIILPSMPWSSKWCFPAKTLSAPLLPPYVPHALPISVFFIQSPE